jgi:hypothetical protein
VANITLNTQAAGYQNRLTQLREIKDYYGPMIVAYLNEPAERQEIWRTKDPILDELLDIADRIERRTQA